MVNYEQMTNNQVYLFGTIVKEMVCTHHVCGEGFYETALSVKRLSDNEDIIPITVSERLIFDNKLKIGKKIAVVGQFRSYNKIIDGRSKLVLTMFVRDIIENILETTNLVYLNGYVCKQPNYRTTPFSREICDILVAVNRAYNKSDYIPCICWGRNARFSRKIEIGDNVAVLGRIQSRVYQKRDFNDNVEEHVAYEISVNKMAIGDEVEYLHKDSYYKKMSKVFNEVDEEKKLLSSNID